MNAPEEGQLVDVRQRRWVVTDVIGSAITEAQQTQHLVSLSSVEDDGLGEELQVVWELEPGASVHEKMALPEPTGFDPPDRLDAFIDAVRWGAASTADIRHIQSPFRSGIEIEDYQLDPVVRAISMPRVNLLVADDVGLGKTIEAGLVILELILRHRARRVLVVCPSSLQIKWQEEMRDRFGLDFRIVDSALLKDLRRRRGIHANPWRHFPRLITSMDFLKRDRPMRLFREELPQPGDSIYPRRFDVLILDEAHNVAPAGRGQYALDSMRTAAIRTIAPHFEHKLFLSATPHNGYQESFSALLELLDDQRFARAVKPDPNQLHAVMVRRLKSELPPDWKDKPRFPKRDLEALEIAYTPADKRAHTALKEYTELRLQGSDDATERYAAEFVLKLLKKRLFSSPEAFRRTLARHEQSLKEARKKTTTSKPSIGILRRQVDRVDEEHDDDAEVEDSAHEAVDVATRLFREPSKEEATLLKEMRDWATETVRKPDSKAAKLIQWLHTHIKPGGKWSNERVIIFTEYRATQSWLLDLLAAEKLTADERLMVLYGGMKSEDRERIKAAFQFDPEQSPVRILLATDAASEGIDLQRYCSRLIHYEIPWNPNRMEQRNGRIDRHGQRANTVKVYHFVGKGFAANVNRDARPGDLEGDLEFLMRAATKVNTIREDLGKVGPVIADQVEQAMLGRRSRLDTTQAELEAAPVRKLLKLERDLKAQIAKLLEQCQESRRDLRLSPENVQKVVEIALELAGQPPLIPTELKGIFPDPTGKRTSSPVFELPALKGSWAACSDGLIHPHTGNVRPIVFDQALAARRDDVVLVHLNHRLVQMSLRLLRAEVWSQEGRKRLHRVTARVVPNDVLPLPVPAVIGHARLVVIGGDSHRLHEEIITAGGLIREGRFARMNVGQVRDALSAGSPDQPAASVKKTLTDLWPKLEEPLIQSLQVRMNDLITGLQTTLKERADKEAGDITAILTELKKTIERELKQPEVRQLELFTSAEKEQLERNIDSLEARVKRIPQEIEHEVAAIRSRFANPQARLFPVAVTFLVPQKLAKG